MNQNYLRHHFLHQERLLQIFRQGIAVRLQNQSGISPAYLQFNYFDKIKVQKLFSSKIKLGLYTSEGKELLIFDLDAFYFKNQSYSDLVRIYLAQKNKIRHIPTQNLILTKNNATIGVFKKICLSQHNNIGIFPIIDLFLNDPNFFDVQIKKEQNLVQFYPQNDLNEAQNQAIKKAFQYYVSFVKGPPGCGKTKTIARMARLFGQKGMKILVGAVSNIANKSLLIQIIKQVQQNNYLFEHYNHNKKINLLLYSSRIQEESQCFQMSPYSLNWKIIQYFLQINSNDLYNQYNIVEYLKDYLQNKKVPNTFLSIYYQAYAKVIHQADIIISTTVSATKINNRIQNSHKFYPDLCIIDQASQATWSDTSCFLVLGVKRVVFVGDQKQLQPTVISQNKQLKKTMFDTLCLKNKQTFTLLNTQYRMNPQISIFPNQYFYQGKILNGKQAEQQISEIEYFKKFPISFIQHNEVEQECVQTKVNLEEGKKHFYNQFQIQLVLQTLKLFPKEQLKNVGIITFYDRQLQYLKYRLFNEIQENELTIKTCDGYQGGEKDYIIVSTVRCNSQGKIGFCKEENRVNVTITRAKKGLILIGNAYTLMQAKDIQENSSNLNVWGSLINYLSKKSLIFTIDTVKHFTKQNYFFEKQHSEIAKLLKNQ